MDESNSLISVAVDGHAIEVPAVTVTIPKAAAEHTLGWTIDQRTKSVHEGGHVVVSAVLDIPIESVSIKGHLSGITESALGNDSEPQLQTDTMVRNRIVVCFAGLAAEIRLLGQGTIGNDFDIDAATNLAIKRIGNGLEDSFPPISISAFGFGGLPPWLLDKQAKLVIAELERARGEATRRVDDNADAILAFAARLFAARRLDSEALDTALREVGLENAKETRKP